MKPGSHNRIARASCVAALVLATLLPALPVAAASAAATTPAAPAYAVLAWNTLGMHCYNRDCQDLLILPPHNVLRAQVVQVGDPPRLVTDGIAVEYRVVDNTYSVGKTNFWTYAQALFGLAAPLPPNVGLTGKGLSGKMDLAGDCFEAAGVPLTEFLDSAPRTPQPFQRVRIIVRDSATGRVLASTTTVAPVSSEIHCDNCHGDTGDATTSRPITPTGRVETNILALHDYLNPGAYAPPLLSRRPVLCAGCHGSNALGAAGLPGVSSLSNAIHRRHKDLPDVTPDTAGCYNCHPGPATRCLRDAMSQRFRLSCVDCHGTMAAVAQNADPWLNEPRCDNANCHGTGYALEKPLYRESHGHGGAYCAGCHDSPHAIAPSREQRDAVKFVGMQGFGGALRRCTACHATRPTAAFRHIPRPAP
jgi:hypothetical protein